MDWRLFITGDNEKLYRNAVEDAARRYGGKVLVDLGSGDGRYSKEICAAAGAKKIVCVDHDEKFLRMASADGVDTVVADLNVKLTLKTNTADVVTANQVIEHIAKTDLFVHEVKRILKPGGSAIICTPNLSAWHNIVALVRGFQPFSMQVSDDQFLGNPWHPLYKREIHESQAHLRVFTMRGLKDLLEMHGLQPVEMRGVGYYPLPAWLAPMAARIDPTHAAYLLVVAKK